MHINDAMNLICKYVLMESDEEIFKKITERINSNFYFDHGSVHVDELVRTMVNDDFKDLIRYTNNLRPLVKVLTSKEELQCYDEAVLVVHEYIDSIKVARKLAGKN